MPLILLSRQTNFTETVKEIRAIYPAYRALLRLVDNLLLLLGSERSLSLTSVYMHDAHPDAVDDCLGRGLPPKQALDETSMETAHKVSGSEFHTNDLLLTHSLPTTSNEFQHSS